MHGLVFVMFAGLITLSYTVTEVLAAFTVNDTYSSVKLTYSAYLPPLTEDMDAEQIVVVEMMADKFLFATT
jgi:hypothetical protein